jgi:hypothetical protein
MSSAKRPAICRSGDDYQSKLDGYLEQIQQLKSRLASRSSPA